jgi:hypothetical protein
MLGPISVSGIVWLTVATKLLSKIGLSIHGKPEVGLTRPYTKTAMEAMTSTVFLVVLILASLL